MENPVFLRSIAKEPIQGEPLPRKRGVHGVVECKNHRYNQRSKEKDKIQYDEDGESVAVFL
ncbi:hypothetical protein DSECCO2_603900 [anaerobic digester metagenome]